MPPGPALLDLSSSALEPGAPRWLGPVLVVAAYLLGSVPFGLLLARLKGIDLRRVGSGNIGATNTARALGRSWGLLAFLLDFGKGWLPAFLALSLAPVDQAVPLATAAGAAAVVGHCFPVYLRFRGGKGVATGCGAVVAIEPLVFLAGGAAWLVALALFRFVSLSSLVMGVAFPVAAWLLRPEEPAFLVGALGLALLVFLRHQANLGRLLAGTEPRVGARPKEPSHG